MNGKLVDPTAIAQVHPVVTEWALASFAFDPSRVGQFESLFALGNGVWVSRGAAIEAEQSAPHYPGSYRAGLYDRRVDWIEGEHFEHEDLVNLPNWLHLRWRSVGGDWFDRSCAELLDYEQRLCLKTAVLHTRLRYREHNGHITRVQERRVVNMGAPHLAASELTLEAENWSGVVEVCSAIDGRIQNLNVEAYAGTDGEHWENVHTQRVDADTVLLEAQTRGTRVRLAIAARTTGLGKPLELTGEGYEARVIALTGRCELTAGKPMVVEKVAAMFTSLDWAAGEPVEAARRELRYAPGFQELLATHQQQWDQCWQRFYIDIVGHSQLTGILRFHLFQLLQTVSQHTAELDAGIPGRGWHGEGYRGHIFWDELFVFPIIVTRVPELSRALLMYRYRRLPEARRAAREAGYQGAMFPWRSASDGREVTDRRRKNPKSGRWIDDHSHLQRHINAAVCFNAWRYFEVTGDREFLETFGAELILETARFWSSVVAWDTERRRYVIRGVVGPDEFHDAYPGAARPGIDNNAYTNIMAVWNIERALEVLSEISAERAAQLRSSLNINQELLEKWRHITRRMFVPYEHGLIHQFEGFGDLRPLDWQAYRESYGDIHRLDDILEAEGDHVNRYQATKQADVLMLFYLLPTSEVARLLVGMGYPVEGDLSSANLDYYLARTSHGSTLSRVVHALVLAGADRSHSWALLQEALGSDLRDIQGGTTREGLHLGAMAGTVDIFQRCYLGVQFRAGELWFDPLLPADLDGIKLRLRVREAWVDVNLNRPCLTVGVQKDAAHDVACRFRGLAKQLAPGETHEFTL